MKHCAGLHDERDAKDIRAEADVLLRLAGTATSTDGNQTTTDWHRPLRLMDAERSEEETKAMEMDEQEDANAWYI
jgi:hypothetical protein